MKTITKNILNIALVILILINISSSYYVPKTNAKYLTSGSINYDTSFYTIKNDFKVTYKSREVEDDKVYVTYKVTFSRNAMLYPGDSDEYYVYANVNDVAGTCEVTSPNNAVQSYSEYAYISLDESSTTTKFTFLAKCDVTDVVDSASIHIRTEEQIGTQTFVLGNVTKTYSNVNLYEILLDYFQNSSDFNDYSSTLRNHMNSYFRHYISSVQDLYDEKVVPGLTYNAITGTYEINSDFIGYAITYARNGITTPITYRLSFSDIAHIVETFRYYLKEYLGYDDEYIALVENYILDCVTLEDLKTILKTLPTSSDDSLIYGLRSSPTPTIAGIYEIRYEKDKIENMVNINYKSSNSMFIASNLNSATKQTMYETYISGFNYDELSSNEIIKQEFVNLEDNESKLFILDATKETTSYKLLINLYRSDGYNYLNIQTLEDNQTITINNNTTLDFYDLVNDPTGETIITASDYDEITTLEIINSIGKYAFNDTYEETLESLEITEINNTIYYTLKSN